MPRICYKKHRFSDETWDVVEQANEIIEEFAQQGFDLTLRQLYYQFVARDLIPNSDKSYARLGKIVNDARMAGYIDWDAIVDRTRRVRENTHWESPTDIVEACSRTFKYDKWEDQPIRVECFHPDTPLLTRDGFIPISNAKIGMEVMTHRGRFRRITKVIENHYDGKMVEINAVGIPQLLVTPSHPIYARPHDSALKGYKGARRKFLPIDWVDSHTLKKFDRLLIPRFTGKPHHQDTFNLSGGPRAKDVSFQADHLTWKMVGLYLSEGNIRSDKRTVQFTIGESDKRYVNIIESWANRSDLKCHSVPGAGTVVAYVYSKALCNWLTENFGNGAFNKRLPQWLIESPRQTHLQVLEYYFRGDGCFWDESRAAITASSRSQNLILQVQFLLLQSGFATAVDNAMDHGELTHRVSVGGLAADQLADLWKLTIPQKGLGRSKRYNHIVAHADRNFSELPIRSVSPKPYKGPVINLEVEEDHTYCVPFVAHNCWIEKDALVGVFEQLCHEEDIPLFSCRGYTSQSAQWRAGQRMLNRVIQGEEEGKIAQATIVLHLGDHDPSGIDMTRDIESRLKLFMGEFENCIRVERLALNIGQVHRYDPPPNPAKLSDSRAKEYIKQHGYKSWELDALDPITLNEIVRSRIYEIRKDDLWKRALARERNARKTLGIVANALRDGQFDV